MDQLTAPQAQAKTGQTVIVGYHYWGVGDTLDEAKRNMRKAGGRLGDGYYVVVFDDQTTFDGVDMAGGISYRGNPPIERRQVAGSKTRRS